MPDNQMDILIAMRDAAVQNVNNAASSYISDENGDDEYYIFTYFPATLNKARALTSAVKALQAKEEAAS